MDTFSGKNSGKTALFTGSRTLVLKTDARALITEFLKECYQPDRSSGIDGETDQVD